MPGIFRPPPQPTQRARHATVARGSAYAATIKAEPGLVAYWRMGEASGNLTDLVAGKVFTAVGTPTYAATGAIFADSDKAINFDASGDRFSTPDHADFDFGNGPFSIEFWAKRNSTGATLFIALSKTTQFNVYWQADVLKIDNDSSAIVTQTGTLTDTASWHHVVYARSGPGAGNNKLYLDNVDTTTNGPGIDAALTANAVALVMGAYNDGSLPFLGQLDEVAFYNVMLSPSKVNQHYQIGTTGISTGASVAYDVADAIGITETLVRVGNFFRTAADSVGQTSQVSKTAVKTAADSVGVTDALTRVGTFVRTAAEGWPASEFIIGETMLGTNVLAGAGALSASGVGITDSVAAVKSGGVVNRTAADSVGVTSTVARLGTFGRIEADSMGVTDAVTRAASLNRIAADSVGRTDSLTRLVTLARSAADSIGLTDALARLGTFARSSADSVGRTDALVRTGSFARSAADSVGLTDLVSGTRTTLRTAADSVGLTDAAVRAVGLLRATTDSVGQTSVVARAVAFARTSADSIGITDLVTGSRTFLRSLADSIGLTDAAARTGAFGRSSADSVGQTDAPARVAGLARSAADSLGVTSAVDAVKSGGIVARSAADSIGLTDAVARAVALARSAADSTGVTDAVTRGVSRTRTAADSIGVTSAVSRVIGTARTAADALGITDAATRAWSGLRVLADAIGLTELVAGLLVGANQPGTVGASVAGVRDSVGAQYQVIASAGSSVEVRDTVGAGHV